MSLSATTIIPAPVALHNVLAMAGGVKGAAQAALSALQSNVDTAWCFNFIDQCLGMIGNLNSWKTVVGLNAAATAEMSGYAGVLTDDIEAVISAAQACINWIVANFPTDTATHTYILAYTLNADGTRTSRVFTPTQTAGLRTLVQAFIASIG